MWETSEQIKTNKTKNKLMIITLERYDEWGYDVGTLKMAALNYPFVLEVDREDRSKLSIKNNEGKVISTFEYETAEKCERELSWISNVLSNEDTWNPHISEFAPIVLNTTWDDNDMMEERDRIRKERKEAWEICDCQIDEGCEKCTKNPKFEIKYAKPLDQF